MTQPKSGPSDSDRRRGPAAQTARLARLCGLIGAITLVGACGELNFRRDLGLVSQGPDEFKVIKQKPLQMPDSVAQLPAPKPGAPSLVEPNPEADARAALLGGSGAAPGPSGSAGAGESALVRAAGADAADPSIRATLEEEAAEADDDVRLLDRWLGRGKPSEDPLDASEEARRLAEEAQRGKNPGLVLPPPAEPKK